MIFQSEKQNKITMYHIVVMAVIIPLFTAIHCFHFSSEMHMQIYLDTVIISHLIGISLGIFWMHGTMQVAMDTPGAEVQYVKTHAAFKPLI